MGTMKRMHLESTIIVSLMLLIGACSTSKPKDETVPDTAPPSASAEAGTDAVPQPLTDTPSETPDASATPDMANSAPAESAPATPSTPSESTSSSEGSTETYTVQAGDTLMKIAYDTLGDIYKWREIYEQ